MLLREDGPADVAAAPPVAARAPFLRAGNPRPVLRAASGSGDHGVLALVLDTEGSTYAHAGAMACFGAGTQVGWLSGGCLEPALALEATGVAASGRLGWMEIDTRGDEDLLSGSALGCRGRLRIALLPLRRLRGLPALLDAWCEGGTALAFTLGADGAVVVTAGDALLRRQVPADPVPWPTARPAWSITVPRPPSLLLFGGGPEAPALLRLLHDLGWHTTFVERRPRWQHPGVAVDVQLEAAPGAVLAGRAADAALVMHHHFEFDREALEALAGTAIPFIGLLGPRRRRDDLFKLLRADQRAALAPRLRAPVGVSLGGQGPEAIALSIAAQLQGWRAAPGPR